jgi:hypothetical protein
MSNEYKFRIADSYTPDTLPMERLAEYMAAFARLLGEPKNVHFQTLKLGSAVLVAKVDSPALPKVRERVLHARNADAPQDVLRAFNDLDEMLRSDNATGELIGEQSAVVLPFPGKSRPAPLTFGPFKQEGSLDGQLIRVGGKDETVPIHLRDGPVIHTGLSTSPEIARRIAPHYLGPTLRVFGNGTWFRDGNGVWTLRAFKITDFEVLDDTRLRDVVDRIHQVKGSTWNEVPDPVRQLLEERHGDGSAN